MSFFRMIREMTIGSDVFVKHPFFIWNRTCMTKKHNSVLKKFLFAKHK